MSEYVFISSLFLSIFLEFCYLFFIQYISKCTKKKLVRIANTFLFEVTPKFSEKTSFINYVFLFGLGISFLPYIYYLFYNVQVYSVSMLVIAAILLFVLCFLPFIGLDKLREHLYLDIAAFLLLASLFIIESYYSFTLYRLYQNDHQLVALIVALVLLLFALILIFNPRLFDLKNNVDESGLSTRKKVVWLALSEWLLYPLSALSLIPLILITIK